MRFKGLTAGLASMLALSACVVAPPTAPGVMALPGAGKDFGLFQQEDGMCRNYAYNAGGGAAGAQAATNNAAGTAVIGTLIGAGLGAALGSLSGQAGTGAAVGGVAGALVGGSAGAGNAQASSGDMQQRYDSAYTQCMYSRGNTVQSPPGGYRAAYPGPYAYPGYGYGYGYGAPTVVIGTGWGWGGHRGYYRRW